MTPGRFNSIRQFLSFGHFRKFCKQQFGEDQKKRVFPFKRDVSIWSKMPAAGRTGDMQSGPPTTKHETGRQQQLPFILEKLGGGKTSSFFFEKTFSHQKGRTWEDTLLAEHLSPAIRPVCMCIRDVYRDARRRKKEVSLYAPHIIRYFGHLPASLDICARQRSLSFYSAACLNKSIIHCGENAEKVIDQLCCCCCVQSGANQKPRPWQKKRKK